MKRIEAVHNPSGDEESNGVWVFTCYAHPEVKGSNFTEAGVKMMSAVSSPNHALKVMRDHIDSEHSGELFSMSRSSGYSGSWQGNYTGKRRAS